MVGGVVFTGLGAVVVGLVLLGFGLDDLGAIDLGVIDLGVIGLGVIGRGMRGGDGAGCAHEMTVFWISFQGNSAIRIKQAVTQNAAIMFLVLTNWAGVRVGW